MALDALQATQLGNLLAGHSKLFTANNPGQNAFADFLLKSGQAAQMGLLAEKEEKKRKKEKKGLFGGKIGSALGTAAGLAIPIPGVNVAVAGALGGGLGGLAGQALSGGSPTPSSFAMNAMQGGLQGYTYGKAGELANSVETAAVQPDIPASPPIAQQMESSIAKALPDANTLSPGTVPPGALANLPAPSPAPGTPPQGAMAPAGAYPAPLPAPGAAGVATPAPRAGLGSRFGSALSHIMRGPAPQAQERRYYVRPDGQRAYY